MKSDRIIENIALQTIDMTHELLGIANGGNAGRHLVDLNPTQINTLIVIHFYNGKITMTKASERVGIQKGAFTRVVDALCKKNLIIRERSENDRRKIYLALTDSGKLMAKNSFDDIKSNLKQKIATLNEMEKNKLSDALDEVAFLIKKANI